MSRRNRRNSSLARNLESLNFKFKGRPQPNQVEVSEAQEDRMEPTEPTQLTHENRTP